MLTSVKKGIKHKTSGDYVTEMTHNNTALHSQIQRGKAAEASSSCQPRQDEEEELHFSVKEVTYSALDAALKELKKGRKARKFSVPTAQHYKQTGEDDAETPYNIVNVEQLQCWADTESEQFLEALTIF